MDVRTVLVLTALAFSAPPGPAADYAQAVSRYVANDYDGAAEGLARLAPQDIRKEVQALVQRSAPGDDQAERRLEAAAMLHTEFAMLAEADNATTVFHVDMARLLLTRDRTLAQRFRTGGLNTARDTLDRTRVSGLLTRWCALASSVLLLRGLDQRIDPIVDEVLRLFPDDPRMLFGRALLTEFHAVWPPPSSAATSPNVTGSWLAPPAAADPFRHARVWGPSEAAYRRVIAADPGSIEAHLHLGFVLAAGNQGEARSELEAARDRAADPWVACLANLFLGRLSEAQGDLEAATKDYERALLAVPTNQSAFMALSLLDERRGRPQQARDLLARFAALSSADRPEDPWWGYHTSRIPVDDLRWLREQVHR